jgi:hypothetical protein
MKREQKPEDIQKITSVWDYKDRPSIMAKDETLRRSQAATKGRTMHSPLPAHMQIFKEKR